MLSASAFSAAWHQLAVSMAEGKELPRISRDDNGSMHKAKGLLRIISTSIILAVISESMVWVRAAQFFLRSAAC